MTQVIENAFLSYGKEDAPLLPQYWEFCSKDTTLLGISTIRVNVFIRK